MYVGYGKGQSDAGPGVSVQLTKEDVENAIRSYLVAYSMQVYGDCEILVNGQPVDAVEVNVVPEGYVLVRGKKMCGGGPTPRE